MGVRARCQPVAAGRSILIFSQLYINFFQRLHYIAVMLWKRVRQTPANRLQIAPIVVEARNSHEIVKPDFGIGGGYEWNSQGACQ